MARNVIAIIMGLVVGFIVVAGVEMINYGLFPLPQELDPADREGMIEHIRTLPPLAYIIVLIAHISGAFFAALVASFVAETKHMYISLGLGLFFTVMGVINLITIPHPVWFSILDTVVYLPAAYAGFLLWKKWNAPKPDIST